MKKMGITSCTREITFFALKTKEKGGVFNDSNIQGEIFVDVTFLREKGMSSHVV